MRITAIVSVFLVWTSAARPGEPAPSDIVSAECRVALPVLELPGRVPATEGKVTLWADFGTEAAGGVRLFLVNNTNQEIRFTAQDYDPYMKLEVREAEGSWRRAQPHEFSQCNNSNFDVSLPARQFFHFLGYQPEEGVERTVRFRSLRNDSLVSNEGIGRVATADLEAAVRDAESLREIPWAITELIDFHPRHASYPPPLTTRIDAARLLKLLPRNEAALVKIRALRTRIAEMPDDAHVRTALGDLDSLLAFQWSDRPESNTLFTRCRDRLVSSDTEAGDPVIPEHLAWQILSQAARPASTWKEARVPGFWKPLLPKAIEVVKRVDTPVAKAAFEILREGWITDSLLPDSEAEACLESNWPKAQQFGAEMLARRSRFKRLAELGRKLSPETQITVLKALAIVGGEHQWPPGLRNPDFEADWEFWGHCAESQPLAVANALYLSVLGRGGNPFNRLIHDPLHKFLAEKAERDAAGDDFALGPDGHLLRTAVQMLGTWGMREDRPVFHKLLGHRGYQEREILYHDTLGRRRVLQKRYLIREVAKEALIAQGEPLPADLITEVEVPISEKASEKQK